MALGTFFFLPPFPFAVICFPGGQMDYGLTLQDRRRQSVKTVCICQSEYAATAAGLRDISHLSPRRVEADFIADY